MTRTSDTVDPTALQRAWRPGTSPWNGILPYFDRICGNAQVAGFFEAMRTFVAAARSEPSLAARHVHPSTINMTVFETADPIEYHDAARYRRVVISPAGPNAIRVRVYPARHEKPERPRIAATPDEPVTVESRVRRHVKDGPVPTLEWVGDPREGIEFIRKCFNEP